MGDTSDALVGTMPVVMMDPVVKSLGALSRALVSEAVVCKRRQSGCRTVPPFVLRYMPVCEPAGRWCATVEARVAGL